MDIKCIRNIVKTFWLVLALFIAGCYSKRIQPIYQLNSYFAGSLLNYNNPILIKDYVLAIIDSKGQKRMQLIDLKRKKIIPMQEINSLNSQVISASFSSQADKIAFIVNESNKNKLYIFNRKKKNIRSIDLSPAGVPVSVTLSASGKTMAIQVIRNGKNVIDIMQLIN